MAEERAGMRVLIGWGAGEIEGITEQCLNDEWKKVWTPFPTPNIYHYVHGGCFNF